jgi:hypothetical protein
MLALAFASGTLIAALAFELFPEAGTSVVSDPQSLRCDSTSGCGIATMRTVHCRSGATSVQHDRM